MSQDDNLKLVREIYDAVGRGDVAAILDRVTDDVDWSAEAAGHAAPWHGPRTGPAGVASFFSDLAGSIEITEFIPHAFATGEDDVLPRDARRQHLGEHLLRGAVAVAVGGLDERAARVDERAELSGGAVDVGHLAPRHRAEADARDLQPASTDSTSPHGDELMGCLRRTRYGRASCRGLKSSCWGSCKG